MANTFIRTIGTSISVYASNIKKVNKMGLTPSLSVSGDISRGKYISSSVSMSASRGANRIYKILKIYPGLAASLWNDWLLGEIIPKIISFINTKKPNLYK